MGQTVAFYFLSEETEVHRRNMAKVKKHAFAEPDPVVRWWLIRTLESAGEPLFACTKPIAEAVEKKLGGVLNYWANRHYLAEDPSLPGLPAGEYPFLEQALDEDQRRKISAIIETVFDNMEEQFSLSLRAAVSGVFHHAASTLPPPRHSHVLELTPGNAASRAHAELEWAGADWRRSG
jgi:hypothetical protein